MDSLGEWYIEVNGSKVGPFTLDQVRGLLDDGEIRHYHQVTSVLTGGQWISVQEALQEALQKPPSLPGEFSPPPRPEIGPPAPVEDRTDPTLTLFDALQVVRERRESLEPLLVSSGPRKKPLFKVPYVVAKIARVKQVTNEIPVTPRMFWAAVFAGLILGSLTFGMVRIFKHRSQPQVGKLTPIRGAFVQKPISPPVFSAPLRPMVPPPPAHVMIPPRIAAPNLGAPGGESNEPPREQYPPQQPAEPPSQYQDGGYPPAQEDNGYAPGNNGDNGQPEQYPLQNRRQYPRRYQQPYQPQQNPQQNSQQNYDGQQSGDPGSGNAEYPNSQPNLPNGQNPDGQAQGQTQGQTQDGNAPALQPPINAPSQDQFQPVEIPQQ